MICIGIDPGLTGAVAVLIDRGRIVEVCDTPTLILSKGNHRRHEYDLPGMVAIVRHYASPETLVTIEDSQAMPGQGLRSTWTTGYGFGLWLGVLTALALPYRRIRPASWKKALGVNADKESARLVAQQLFPTADLRLKKHHGRAEALLLAWYGHTCLWQ